MAKPIILRTKAETEGTAKAFVSLAATVATSMASVSSAALIAHQATGSSLGGIAGTAAKAAASLTAMQYVAIAAFAAFSAAAAAGAAELARFEEIAKKASASGVGTTFFQSFIEGARTLRIEARQLEADLAALERSTRDRFDNERAGGVSSRARDLLQERFRGTNDFGLSNAPTLFDNARDPEERIRAVLVALRDMEAAGQKLAAIDLARQLGLNNLAEQVDRGKTTFAGFASEVERVAATGVRDGTLVSPELVAQADALKQRWEANSRELSQNLRPILDECARLAAVIGSGAAWTAEQFTALIGVVGRVVAVFRQATVEATALQGAAARVARIQIGAEPSATDAAGQAQAARDAAARRFQRATTGPADRIIAEADGEASREARRAAALGGLEPRLAGASFSAPVPNVRPVVAGAGSTGGSSRAPAAETDEWAKAYERLINNLEKANAQLQAEFATIGRSNVERARAVELAKAEAEARRTGGALTDEQRARVLALAEAQARLRDAIKDAEASQRAFGDAIQYAGDRLVDMAFNGRSLQDVLRGLAAELMRAALTGQGVFGRLLGLAPSAGAPAGSVGGLLGLVTSGVSGGIGNLFGGAIGGSTGTNLLGGLLGFSRGGYTGAGDPSAVAGVAHRGEFVFDAAATSRIGVDTLEAIRNARAGPPRMAELASASAGVTVAPIYHIDARGADEAAIARLERGLAVRDAEFGSRVIDAVRDAQDRRML